MYDSSVQRVLTSVPRRLDQVKKPLLMFDRQWWEKLYINYLLIIIVGGGAEEK